LEEIVIPGNPGESRGRPGIQDFKRNPAFAGMIE